ncbi:MAG: hypothetical protein ISR76_00520 [Planctomycetes bacterium]|nr:hypothetical protein [Planctomycetota bacterium]
MPVAIRNNTEGGHEARIRESFKEPAWNNPVVRFLGPGRTELAGRLYRKEDWSRAALSQAMVAALAAAQRPVPGWLEALQDEENAPRRELGRAVFGMP